MTNVSQKPLANYQAVLVRMCRDDTASPWRASAQAVGSEEVQRFSCLEHLFVHLQQLTRESQG